MSPRLEGRRLLGLACAVLLATCRYDVAGPGRGGPAYIAVQPVVDPVTGLGPFGLTADTIRLLVVRPPADTVRALRVYFDPDSSQIRLAVTVGLRAAVETLTVRLELRGGGFALFSGSAPVEVRVGRPATPQEILVTYTGPGSGIAGLTIEPRDTVLSFADSLRFRVTALDSSGASVPLFYLRWTTTDTSVLRVNAAGVTRAPKGRALVYVRARTPSGAADSTPLTVIPLPTALSVLGGVGQIGVVGLALQLPLRVRVTALDGLGVKGIPVQFRALSGGAVAEPVVVSDTGGYAQTIATLGTVAGPQTFEASALALPATKFGVTALPGAVSAATSLVTASAATLVSGTVATLTLRARDAFGNDLTTGGLAVVFAATGGTSTGLIGPTTDRGDGTYTATFTGVLAGTASAIGATIDGSPVTSAPLPAIAVLAGAVARVLVTPASAALDALGFTQQFSAVAQDANGNVVPGQAFAWTSSDGAVAAVGTGGLVTALGNGAAGIIATAAGVSGTASLTVAQVVRSVVVSPATANVLTLATQQFSAVALDGNGRQVAGQTFTWSSSDLLIASIDPTGLATALALGTALITATTGGVSGTATMSVL